MAETNEARVDKWLWAARIFKTRSIAADAIKNGRVTIQGMNVKPSRMVKVGEVISVRKPPVTYSEMNRISGFIDRQRGTGRPTKKDRRALDEFVGPALEGYGDFDFDFDEDDI